MLLTSFTGKCVVIGMQTTGESAMKQSQDFDDFFSSDSKDDTGDDDDFISSPAMTLQNVILKCFPRPAFSDIPSKHRRAIKKRKELRSLRHNSMFTSDIGTVIYNVTLLLLYFCFYVRSLCGILLQ